MNARSGQIIFTTIAIILAALFIGLTLKDTDFEVLREAAREADYIWFLASMALSIFSYWLRAARWKLLLEPIGHPVRTQSGFWAISFAYFMNLTIPRSGEIARATSLYKMEKVPADKSIGTIVLERVIDVFFLGLFFLLTLVSNSGMLFSFFSLSEKPSPGKFLIAFGLLTLMGIVFFFIRNRIRNLKLYQKGVQFLRGIWIGFKSILKLRKRTLFVVYSFAIWFCYFLMTYLVFFAFPATSGFGLSEGFFLIVAGALGMILPAVGGLGYPYVMSMAFAAVFMANGQTDEEGKTIGNYFGLMLYFAQVISILIFGFLAIYFIGKTSNSSKKPKSEISSGF